MDPIYFKALLKTEDGHLLEQGYACISLEHKSVDFHSDFVPLMKMGTAVQIVQVAGDQELHVFRGEVYLSSPKMLRIVSVSDEELIAAEKQLEAGATLPVQLRPVHGALSAQLVPERMQKDWITGEIYALSPRTVKFSCPLTAPPFPAGQKLLLQMEEPLVRKMVVQVYQILLFGEGITGYLCEVESVPEPYRANLERYLEQLSAQGRVFPPGELPPPPPPRVRHGFRLPHLKQKKSEES